MPKINEMYPSNYLKADDFADGDATLTIADIRREQMGKGRDASDKWVMYFEELEKGFVLNKTNSTVIARLLGDDTDDWIGHQITLYCAEVEFQGSMVEAIRVRLKLPKKVGKPARPEPKAQAPARPSAATPRRPVAAPAPDGAGDAFDDDLDPTVPY